MPRAGHQDRRRLLRSRSRVPPRAARGRGGADRAAARHRELPGHRQADRRRPRHRGRGGASGLWLPGREREASPRPAWTRARPSSGRRPPPSGRWATRWPPAASPSSWACRWCPAPSSRSRTTRRPCAWPSGWAIRCMLKAAMGGGGKGMRLVRAPGELAGRAAGRALGGGRRVRRRRRLHRALRRGAAAHRDPGAGRRPRRRRVPGRARVLDPAAAPEAGGGEPVALRHAGDAAPDGRGGLPGGRRGRLRQRGHRRVPGGPRAQLLLPRDEHAPAGGASGDRAGDRARSREGPAPDRGGGEARLRPGRRRAPRLGHRVPHQRGGPVRGLHPVARRRWWGCGRRAGPGCATIPASTRAARSRASTTR